MSDSPKTSLDLARALIAAKTRKTNLEIAGMERPKRDVMKYIPVVTGLVAVLGLIINSVQTQQARTFEMDQVYRSQSLAETQRLHNQLRTDKEQLLQFMSDDKFSTARVVFLLDDLNSILSQLSSREDLFKAKSNETLERQKITDLLQMLIWQVAFDQERHIDFDVQALQRWPQYKDFWIANGPSHHLLLSKKYYTAILNSLSTDGACIQGLEWNDRLRRFVTTHSERQCEQGVFPALVVAFKLRLQIMKEAGRLDFVKDEIAQFNALTKGSKIAKSFERELLSETK
jgi:hypothetical protein